MCYATSPVLRTLFVTLPKWTLVALGAYLVLGLAAIEMTEHRLGLGIGVSVALVLGIIKGASLALQPWLRPRSEP
jgi:hypothetical protein